MNIVQALNLMPISVQSVLDTRGISDKTKQKLINSLLKCSSITSGPHKHKNKKLNRFNIKY